MTSTPYTVLARKYRPQIFADLVGQEHVSRTLANAITSGRVAHAFLFTGARGVGKTTTARLLAKALNCEQGPTPTPCNQCDPCREITAGTDLDVLEIDGASNNSVDDVRRLQESLPYRPTRDRFKVVIVDEVHMLSTGAFNAFLKTLEEPPAHVKFIFATTEIHKVPITIRSRCQRHDFRLIPHAIVADRVRSILAQEKITADDAAIAIVVREAAGSLRDALTVLDQLLAFGGDGLRGEEVARGLGIADQRSVSALATALLDGDAATCMKTLAALGQQGLDMLHLSRQLLSLMRDLVVLRVVGDDAELVDRGEDERGQAAQIAAAHSAQHLERSFAGLSKLVEEVGQSAHPQLVLEMGLVRLADRPALEPLSELLTRLTVLEQRLGGAGGGGSAGGGSAGRGDPSGGGARNVRRPPGPIAHELRDARATKAMTPEPSPGPSPTLSPSPSPSPSPNPNPGPGPTTTTTTTTTTSTGTGTGTGTSTSTPTGPSPTPSFDRDQDGVPTVWRDIIAALHADQPALGAVLEHGVPVDITRDKITISFPQGSFFGRQAGSTPARQALAEAAERVLGQRPRIEIGFGLSDKPTVAAQEETKRKVRREEIELAARNHPRVKEALDVFPEVEGQFEVKVED